MFRTFFNPRAHVRARCFPSSLLVGCHPCGPGDDASTPTLYIISPHGSDIRREFQDRFSEWHLKKYGTSVNVRWPDIGGGGTGNIVKQLDGDYAHGSSCGYDLAFGGGSASFELFRQHGLSGETAVG